ncbi:uncharacterized protein LOC142976919 [Anticarsia gemmatalis]|uniref:uncharacterized protein LOC142976919 n=1 Tax=Anticarsia gemmatalis TaxID=129554 RepID=UPI003F773C76
MGHTYCFVFGCNGSSRLPNLSFFRIPLDKRLNVWLKLIGRDGFTKQLNPRSHRVCSIHFKKTMFKNKRLIPSAIPSLYLPKRIDGKIVPGRTKIPAIVNTELTEPFKEITYNRAPKTTNSVSIGTQTDLQCFCKSIGQADCSTSVSNLYDRLIKINYGTEYSDENECERAELEEEEYPVSNCRIQFDSDEDKDEEHTSDGYDSEATVSADESRYFNVYSEYSETKLSSDESEESELEIDEIKKDLICVEVMTYDSD